MTKSKSLSYHLLPEWVITQKGNSLIISGGADAQFEIELEAKETSFFARPRSKESFQRDDLSTGDLRVLEELITAEIVVPKLQKKKTIKAVVMGDKTIALAPNNPEVKIVEATQPHDLVLIIRAQSTYSELLATINYQDIQKPHLFIDIAFHHTFAIGPLVFPGETACVACLQGRVSTRWGDDPPPRLPQVINKYRQVISELISTELARIANGDTSLTNKTVSWNFQDRTIKSNQLLKVPLCPICSQNKIDQDGSLALPW